LKLGYKFVRKAKHGFLYRDINSNVIVVSGTPRSTRPLKYLIKETR